MNIDSELKRVTDSLKQVGTVIKHDKDDPAKMTIHKFQDIDPTADSCKLQRQENPSGWGREKHMMKMGTILDIHFYHDPYWSQHLQSEDPKEFQAALKKYWEAFPELRSSETRFSVPRGTVGPGAMKPMKVKEIRLDQ